MSAHDLLNKYLLFALCYAPRVERQGWGEVEWAGGRRRKLHHGPVLVLLSLAEETDCFETTET